MPRASVLILTLNEEANLAACLDSCAWCDDIVVFDSCSTDRTIEIAKQKGARVEQRVFDNYAAQRNAALRHIEYRHSWVLMVDADERVTPELAAEIERKLEHVSDDTVMFRMRRKDYFFGRWLRRSSGYPTWFGRLVRPHRVRVDREINEEYVAEGNLELLDEHLAHFPFNKGVAWWFDRHNKYSNFEATAMAAERTESIGWAAFLSRDPAERRRCLKRIAYRLPGRPILVFLYLYIARLGLLDGTPGLYYSAMRAYYEMMIDLKVKENLKRRAGLWA